MADIAPEKLLFALILVIAWGSVIIGYAEYRGMFKNPRQEYVLLYICTCGILALTVIALSVILGDAP